MDRTGHERRFRLGARAGAQSLYAACGRDESASGVLRAVGYDMTGGLLPEPVTQVSELGLLTPAA